MTLTSKEFQEAARGYLSAMLWANTYDYGGDEISVVNPPSGDCEAFASGYRGDFEPAPGLILSALRTVYLFVTTHYDECQSLAESSRHGWARVGHNLALSRNGHGAGFFDDGADELQKFARMEGSEDWILGPEGEDGIRRIERI